MELVRVRRREGNFNLIRPEDRQVIYTFTGMGKPIEIMFKLEDDPEPDVDGWAYDVALGLLADVERYLFHPDKRALQHVVNYLGEHQKEQERLYLADKLEHRRMELQRLQVEILDLENRLFLLEEDEHGNIGTTSD